MKKKPTSNAFYKMCSEWGKKYNVIASVEYYRNGFGQIEIRSLKDLTVFVKLEAIWDSCDRQMYYFDAETGKKVEMQIGWYLRNNFANVKHFLDK